MKKMVMFVLALGLFLGIANSAFAITYLGHDYSLVTGNSWLQAEASAVALGGHLVTINDLNEENWLESNFTGADLLIGFSDAALEGTWVWSSGEPITYTNWVSGEPNNYLNEDYAVMNWVSGSQKGWNDLALSNPQLTYSGIAEVNAIPEPASMSLLGLGLLGLVGFGRKRKI